MNKQTTSKIIETAVQSHPGSVHNIKYTKQLKTKKGVDAVITKTTEMYVRFGINYKKSKLYKQYLMWMDQNRKNDVNPSKRKNTNEWIIKGYILKTSTGLETLRCYPMPGWRSITKYYFDGHEITKEQAKALCNESQFKDTDRPVALFNVAIDKIDYLK